MIDLASLGVGAEEFLATVLQTTGQPLWVIDHDGRIRFANPAAIRALGYERADELSGHNSHATIHYRHKDGTPYPADECPLLRPLATGRISTSELDWFVRRDGSMFPVSYLSVPLDLRDGRGAVVSFTDIEDRLRLQEAVGDPDATLAAQHAALRDELTRLADEQAALRRVATLVARGVAPRDLFFAAVAREVGLLAGGDVTHVGRYEADGRATLIASWTRTGDQVPIGTVAPIDGQNVCSLVLRTGRPARMDSYHDASGPIAAMLRELGVRSSVGAPIVVDGRRWGVAIVSSKGDQPLSADTEEMIGAFAELVATAIANTETQRERARLADEQAALRRVATLVAQGVPAPELFGAVTKEVGQLLGTDAAAMIRYGPDVMTAVGSWTAEGVEAETEVGRQWPLEGDSLAPRIVKTGKSARIDDWRDVAGPVGDYVRNQLGLSSSVGSPILVGGRVWGNLVVHSTTGRLPGDTEERLAGFTELVATAIANSEAQGEVRRLAEDQAALRRVATLVARAVPPSELFDAVAKEVGCLLGADFARMIRYEDDGTVSAAAAWAAVGRHPPVPARWTTEAGDVPGRLMETRRPARIDDWSGVPGPIAAFVREQLGTGSSVGSPIIVGGRLWGGLVVHLKGNDPLPADTESRLLNFTELVATAIANGEARAEVERLADEQAGLRRVATLVARKSPPAEVFAAVGEEVGRLLRVGSTSILRYEGDGTATVVARSRESELQVGDRLPLDGESVTASVFRTGRPARLDDYSVASGGLGTQMREAGIRSAVGAPIVVAGRLWGVIAASTRRDEPLPAELESRIGEFTELVATAISNVQAWSDLAASRARIVAAVDEERQRVVRDLHDGAQQRLVHTVITLKLARRALQTDDTAVPEFVTEALEQAERATAELRELAQGILPGVLTHGGLRAGVAELASRTPVPVEVDITIDRLPATIEATAYFVVAEALTNVAKHARASSAGVSARIDDGALVVRVRDDGAGGARRGGTGLLGLADRLAALDGTLDVETPAGGGTLIVATIPIPPSSAQSRDERPP
ncbi:GAF domain-containing protein [Candidatus Solirubrobacter pratensis]|uniref:GAF domain-containing protein n=1 Tax=Candidatus Solirubrobacter pratensis TaxID=1298857 RepID=UPI0018C9773E|nr:GAF domain-containing protein [Candidatus Solirubrobacter pratensis]